MPGKTANLQGQLALRFNVYDWDKVDRGEFLGFVKLGGAELEEIVQAASEKGHVSRSFELKKRSASDSLVQGSLSLSFSLAVRERELDVNELRGHYFNLGTKSGALKLFSRTVGQCMKRQVETPLGAAATVLSLPIYKQSAPKGETEDSVKPLPTMGHLNIRLKVEEGGFMAVRDAEAEEFARKLASGEMDDADRPPPPQVWIQLHGARELCIADDIVGSSDPYAELWWRNKRVGRTKVMKRNLNPIWDTFLAIPIPDTLDWKVMEARIEVYDMDIGGRGDFLGQIVLKGTELARGTNGKTVWKQLQPRQGDTEEFVGGDIGINVHTRLSGKLRAEGVAKRKAEERAIQKEIDEARKRRERGMSSATEIEEKKLKAKKTVVISSLAEVPRAMRVGRVLMRKQKNEGLIETLLEVEETFLKVRESRWHEFVIPEGTMALDLKVSIVYKGTFQQRGYVLGRLAAALYRLPEMDAVIDSECLCGWNECLKDIVKAKGS